MGTTIDALIKEEKRGYSSLLVSLYTDGERRFHEAVARLRRNAEYLIQEIEEKAKTPLSRFTLGKSYARKRKNRTFNPNNFDTWIKEGIRSRWTTTYQKEGYNGLVVLCGITRELLPLAPNKRSKRHPLQDQQQYALALEQQLIHYFLFEAQDSRLGNDSLDKGALAKNPYAGVVYLAFKLYTIREVWQLFQDAFELMEEPSDTIFVIRIEDQKKVIGGRKAEEQVITFLDKEGDNLRGLRIEIFVNYIPSVQFVRDLVHIKARNQQALPMLSNNACDVHIDVIISGNFEDSTETNQEALEMLSNNGYAAREFAEDDWDELAKTLLLPADGINPQKALERKEFKTYLEKSKEEILEMFQESMVETEDQKEKKDEPEDKIFVIRKGEGVGKIIMGRKVENRVIHYLKNLAGAIKIYVNYKPSKRFVQHLVKTVSDNTACVLVASKDEINYVRGGTVAIKTMTENDSQELRVATQYPYPNSLTFH